MKLIRVVILLLTTALIVGCGSVNIPFNNPTLARVEVNTKLGSGKGSVKTLVKSVGNLWVSAGDKYLEIAPGEQKVTFEYEKIIERASGFYVSVSLLGDEENIAMTTGGASLVSNFPITISGVLEAGKTYYVDATLLNTEKISVSQVDYIMGRNLDYRATGDAVLRERK